MGSTTTTRVDAAGGTAGTYVTLAIVRIPEKADIVNPDPTTTRTDAAGASQGTTTQQSFSKTSITEPISYGNY